MVPDRDAPSPAATLSVTQLGKAAGRPAARRLPGLDALRAVAAFMVVVMHAGAIWPNAPHLASASYLAVDFFFLLSGFVMGRTYERRMIAGGLAPMAFLKARYRRLWPTMAIGAVLCVPFLWRDGGGWTAFLLAAAPNILLLPTYATAALFPLNTPAWSIFFELLANMVHAAALYRLRQRELALVVLACFIPLAVAAFSFGTLDLGARPTNMGWGFARVGFSYGLGLLLWRVHGDQPLLRIPPVLALLAMPVLFMAADSPAIGGALFDLAFIALVCPLLLWGGMGLRALGPRLTAVALVAGALSFPLYAIHFPVLLAVEAAGLPTIAGPLAALFAAALVTKLLGGFAHVRTAPYTF